MKGFVIYYTEQDLGGDLAGMFELRSISQYGRVFIDSDCFYALWRTL